MSWTDIPALVISVTALAIALLARGDSKRSARAAEKSAIVAEQTLADQRAAAAPKVELAIEHLGKNHFRLRNCGGLVAEEVRILDRDLPPIVRDRPDGITLPPGVGHDFVMAGAMGNRLPTHVWVEMAGSSEPVALPLPAYP